MSRVFQNIDLPPPSPLLGGGGTHSPGGEGGGKSIFWKTRDIGLPSYSNNLSTLFTIWLLGVAEKDGTRKSPRCAAPAGVPSRHPGRPKLELRVRPANLMLKLVVLHQCLGFGSGFKWATGSGSRQVKIVPIKRNNGEVSCLKMSLLGWRLLLELGCPL